MAFDSREIQTMRVMEWERVKGGLYAILAAYWDDEEWRECADIAEEFMRTFGEAAGLD